MPNNNKKMADFECHITCFTSQAEEATNVAKQLHWKTSEIARDPVLGNDTYFYLTSHSADWLRMFERMKEAVSLLTDRGVIVVREKIEMIVYDVRYSKEIQHERQDGKDVKEVSQRRQTVEASVQLS